MNLGRPDRSARLDALAAEYALGTMPARARRRMASAARADALVARAIGVWETRLATLAEAIPGVTPSPRVWEGVRARLGLTSSEARDRAPASWWASLNLWRGVAVASMALAAALAVSLLAPPTPRPEGAIVVVLAGPDAKPVLLASADHEGRFLTVKALAPVDIAADRALELWGLPTGAAPRSLGLISATGVARVPLPSGAAAALASYPALAVSLEPAGGSPTGQPTGPVLYSGGVQRM